MLPDGCMNLLLFACLAFECSHGAGEVELPGYQRLTYLVLVTKGGAVFLDAAHSQSLTPVREAAATWIIGPQWEGGMSTHIPHTRIQSSPHRHTSTASSFYGARNTVTTAIGIYE